MFYEQHIIIGFIGSIHHGVAASRKVTNLNVAVNREDTTNWYDVALWDHLSEQAQRVGLEKGMLVLVELGRLDPVSYQDRLGATRIKFKGFGRLFLIMERPEQRQARARAV